MKRIIKDVALKKYTWKGTLAKGAFIQFKSINDVIKEAIHTKKDPYTDHHHNIAMKEYCKHATTRLKYKKSRNQNKKKPKPAEVFSDENG